MLSFSEYFVWVCVCVCVCVCVLFIYISSISIISISDMCRSISSLSKITHQMWHDHPFSQRNRSIEGTVEVGFGGDRGVGGGGGLDKIWKRKGRQYREVFILPFLVKKIDPLHYSHFWKITSPSPPSFMKGRGVRTMKIRIKLATLLL